VLATAATTRIPAKWRALTLSSSAIALREMTDKHLSFGIGMPRTIQIAEPHLRSVLVNLIENALRHGAKYIPRGAASAVL
jgi:signal transduction histidine kinase